MKQLIKKISIAIILILTTASICFSYSYEKNSYLPPLKMTFTDLNRIISALRSQVPLESEDKYDKIYEELLISGENITITEENYFEFKQNDRLPDTAEEFSYSYRYSKGKIERIKIFLSENRRFLSIKGTTPDSVDAMLAFLNDQFLKYKITLGGSEFRVIGGFILYIIACCFWVYGYISKKISLSIKCFIIATVILFSTFLLPFSQWFPGFAIYKESASFAVRKASEISLFGVILTIFFFFINTVINKWTDKKSKKNS